jgi:hypothetical protein
MKKKKGKGKMPEEEQAEEERTLSELRETVEEEELDDVVHDAASSLASQVNNGGPDAQVDFLVDQFGVQGTINLVKFVIESREGKTDD